MSNSDSIFDAVLGGESGNEVAAKTESVLVAVTSATTEGSSATDTVSALQRTTVQIAEQEELVTGLSISGTKQDLQIVWSDELTFAGAKQLLKREFKKAPLFFRDAVARIGFESKQITKKQEKELQDACKEAVVLYQKLPLNFKEQQRQANALMIAKTLRSGQKVEYNGHIVILGDVHPGAEVIASGHVIVWGHLRGIAHAGAAGNPKAMVCAMRLNPVQLRIGNFVAVNAEIIDATHMQPEIAFIKSDVISAEPWDTKSFFTMGITLD